MTGTGRTHTRTYAKVVLAVPSAAVDDTAGLLVAEGARGCVLDGVSKSGTSRAGVARLAAYFDCLKGARLARIRRILAAAGMAANGSTLVTERIVDPGWATLWMGRFRPLRIGRRLLIVPPWSKGQSTGRIRIVIKPGQGFGTGHHPTTAGALQELERLCSRRCFGQGLDVGTGSGVLAIAMRLCGLGSVLAIDNDPVALINARENIALNQATRIRLSTAAVHSLRSRFDLITANILSLILIELAPAIKRVLASDGRLVLGGILEREREAVMRHYRPALHCIASRTERGWVTLVLAR